MKGAESMRRLDAEAADWLARRDRGLSPEEQDQYLQWLRASPEHGAALARAEATFRRVLQLSAWQHEHSAEPNPDLLARPKRRPSWWWPVVGAAAAAVLAIGLWSWQSPRVPSTTMAEAKSYLRVNERRVLPDGSRVELKDGSTLDVRYASGERRVRLTGGEAQFSVMKDVARPFVVEVAGVAVRAVGTVFDVRLGSDAVEVLVTEGKVRVGRAASEPGQVFADVRGTEIEPPLVGASQRALVALDDRDLMPVVSDVSSDEISRALAWQAPRLQFDETPLAEAITEFNRRNRHQLVLADAAAGSLRISGTFRPDNVDGFVNLLGELGLRAQSRDADTTVLRRAQ
jgi:transmembrane sensor